MAFRSLEKLKRLQLSSNLLQGEISPDYFDNLKQLVHLEVENNYLLGTLPASMYGMEQLIYLYIRDNDFNVDFPSLVDRANWTDISKKCRL